MTFYNIAALFLDSAVGIFLIILILLLILIRNQLNKQKNLPPGPFNFPIVGYYPLLGKYPYIQFANLKKKYGGIFSVYLGSRYCLVLNDIESMKEAFNQDAVNGRPPNSSFRLSSSTTAFVEHSGAEWSEQRRFSLKVLRNLGFGKTRIEDIIKEEANILLEEYNKSEKQPTMLRDLLLSSINNIVFVMLYGKRFQFDDPKRAGLDEYLNKIGHVHTPVSLHACFPWLKNILFGFGLRVGNADYRHAQDMLRKVVAFNWKEIHSHEETINEDHRDYIDSYLAETTRNKGDNIFTKENLNGNIQLFLRAGTQSTRATFQWCLMGVAANPSMQERIQAEIENVVGMEKSPSWSDREKMPFTEAFIHEIQRWKTAVPINLLRYTTSDTKLKGYNVPAGTIVIGNFWAAHNDPDYWQEPERLIPERFLNEDGTKLLKMESFVPFSLGRRACPGITVAYMVLFLYLTTILQKYNVVFPRGEKGDFEATSHMSFHPTNFRVLLAPRKI